MSNGGVGGSRIARKYPDGAEVLALIEISILLLNGVLRIPAVSSLGHYPDQHSSMARYIEASSQTNHLILRAGSHLKHDIIQRH